MTSEFERIYGAPPPDVIPEAKAKFGTGDYIGVDLDGTWARWEIWTRWNRIGPAIPLMTQRILRWNAAGIEVRVFTARVGFEGDTDICKVTGEKFTRLMMTSVIQVWARAETGLIHRVQAHKDNHMKEIWDDRAVQVVPNTGRSLAEEHEAEMMALRGKP